MQGFDDVMGCDTARKNSAVKHESLALVKMCFLFSVLLLALWFPRETVIMAREKPIIVRTHKDARNGGKRSANGTKTRLLLILNRFL